MFTFNEAKINLVVNQIFEQQQADPNVHNTISEIHPQIHFKYNSLNICLGKQGTGKTTFMLKELIKLSELPDNPYDKIVYITNSQPGPDGQQKAANGADDMTFNALKSLVKIPILGLNFMDATRELSNFFSTREDKIHHTFVIIEDASFLLMKDDPMWTNWICKLRHLRMTVWINLHVWKSISTMIKTQITTLFVFKGFNKEQITYMYRQSSVDLDMRMVKAMYMLLDDRDILKLSNSDGKVTIIKDSN